ncbi:YgiQ family radical SAM protein [Pygmaiobacter massiliensis]|uniref:YgiQ family radical SAM protein n=1 Tax=Pygmaiobacter massiliensis TaxID=1917873 RepID=UPI000C7C6621|nr:YgiQ family radical SAM protein [Pygmaiobacter massiliensis]
MAEFLPVSGEEMRARDWQYCDFVVVSGDAYVDHPSFGCAIISRLLESMGFRVGILSQPDFRTADSFKEFGRPRYAFLVGSGNVDSMVAHYSVSKVRRNVDEYSPGGRPGKRPDRAATVYCNLAKQAYPEVPVVVGGLEASLRRFAHYDYWDDTVMPSILDDCGADLLTFGMGEHQTRLIAERLAKGEAPAAMHDIPGTCYLTDSFGLPEGYIECAGFNKVSADKVAYAKACRIQMDNQDPLTGKPVVQKQKSGKYLVQNKPSMPLYRPELDSVYALPFTRTYHPMYEAMGGIPAIEEVGFSIAQNRGCFGGCNFCAITLHQGRRVTSRSADSILEEGKRITESPNFKGYIHDVGGPTADFRLPSCKEQMKNGMCADRKCLAPTPCPKLLVDHKEYVSILRRLRELPGVKKVFIRSGIRYDYLMLDKDETFFKELIEHHVSGQLKVAPEHCAPTTLKYMGKPNVEVFNRFVKRFYQLTKSAGKKQYLVPYLMSSHPGSTLKDAVELAEWLQKNKMRPEQVQDFYPTPGTVSTCMFYTGLDPYTMKPLYVAKTSEEKALQRALLQYFDPRNKEKVRKALAMTGRTDLLPVLLPYEKRQPAERQQPGRKNTAKPVKQNNPREKQNKWHNVKSRANANKK